MLGYPYNLNVEAALTIRYLTKAFAAFESLQVCDVYIFEAARFPNAETQSYLMQAETTLAWSGKDDFMKVQTQLLGALFIDENNASIEAVHQFLGMMITNQKENLRSEILGPGREKGEKIWHIGRTLATIADGDHRIGAISMVPYWAQDAKAAYQQCEGRRRQYEAHEAWERDQFYS